jgi:glycosyltransferase involved in cell wall biosynthesis
MWHKLVKLYRLIRDPQACGSRSDSRLTVSFVPWWPHTVYQTRLTEELSSLGIRVQGSELTLRELVCLLLNRDQADVVHIHWPHGTYVENYWRFPLVMFHLWLYRLRKNNVVWTVHELDEFYETRYAFLDRMMARFLIKICRQVFVHSNYSAEMIRRRYRFRREIMLMRHPAYVGRYPNDITRESARARFGFGDDALVYLFLGHIKPYKGVEWLIETFAGIPGANKRLLIAGKPFDEATGAHIRRLAASDQRIVGDIGYVSDDKIQVYMNAADVVVFPFRKIHSSGSVKLALSFARPVIAPAIAAIPEDVDERSGILFDPSDPAGLKKALESASGRDLARMGKAAYERVANGSWADFAGRYAAAYAAVAQPRTGR